VIGPYPVDREPCRWNRIIVNEPSCTIDDVGPMPVLRPASVSELAELVRSQAGKGEPIYPLSGRTQLELGLPPVQPGVGVDMTGLAEVIDYPARDMTITVQAGIRISRLQQLLAAEGQRLPIDVPRPDEATLGGALATNTSGPRRFGAGTLRDYLIGISTVNDEGQETKAGGRVVKNVAGYDLPKLHIGALGTLGIITQVTLKVRPRPETQALVIFGCPDEQLSDQLDRLHASRTRPTCIDLLNRRAASVLGNQVGLGLPDQSWVVIVGFEDSEAAVNWQLQQLIKELTGIGVHGALALAGAATEQVWQGLAELPAWHEARLSLKANLLPGRVAGWCLAATRLPEQPLIHTHAGSGIVRAHFDSDLTAERAGEMLKMLMERVGDEGNIILPRCPVAWKPRLGVWGRQRNDIWLMRQVKERLDPRGLFNPGRFIDGI
jgi:glycolate oxidase FAD binding subunit